MEAERDEAAKKAEAIEAAEAAAADSKRELEAVKATLLRTKEDVEGRDSELEAKGRWGHQSDWMEMILWSRIHIVGLHLAPQAILPWTSESFVLTFKKLQFHTNFSKHLF